jgi:hypothetical protein
VGVASVVVADIFCGVGDVIGWLPSMVFRGAFVAGPLNKVFQAFATHARIKDGGNLKLEVFVNLNRRRRWLPTIWNVVSDIGFEEANVEYRVDGFQRFGEL